MRFRALGGDSLINTQIKNKGAALFSVPSNVIKKLLSGVKQSAGAKGEKHGPLPAKGEKHGPLPAKGELSLLPTLPVLHKYQLPFPSHSTSHLSTSCQRLTASFISFVLPQEGRAKRL
jgi:hypothetical protein